MERLRTSHKVLLAFGVLLCAASAFAQGGSMSPYQGEKDGVSVGGKWMMFHSEDKMTGAKRVRFELLAENYFREDPDYKPRVELVCEDGKYQLASFNPAVRVPPNRPGFWGQPQLEAEVRVDDDQFLLSSLADQTAVALENARLVESLVRLNDDFRRAIAALDQANRNLERLDRTKTEFISIASHELHSPLTLVNGYSQVLLEEPELASHPQYAKMLSGIHSGAQRLNEIVESMLDMAKIDTSELQLDLQPLSLSDLINSLHDEVEPALQERNQKFEAVDLASLPAIQGDRQALRKVFYHLLVNAIKYTPDGGKITVSGQAFHAAQDLQAESGVELVVSDTGIGIDPSMNEVIFTKFYQTGELALHSSGKTKFKGGGPGLGLPIARGIIEAHGGTIWVESAGYDEKNCPGSTFHILIPSRTESPDPNMAKLFDTLGKEK